MSKGKRTEVQTMTFTLKSTTDED